MAMEALKSTDLREWYTSTSQPEPASAIFQNALQIFSSELSGDPEKLRWIKTNNHVTMDSVLAAVEDGRKIYEGRKSDSKVREALTKLAEKIHHYGGIMDVIVSHNPEYTALFWGATKFLLVGVINHQKIITRLSDGLVQIANLLPRADLTLRLYPIPYMRRFIEDIYAHTIRFLIRALRWYQESKFKHVIHAITRPSELRYDDILSTISSLSRSMSDAAQTSSQAEQRDMHLAMLKQAENQQILQQIVETQAARILDAIATAGGGQQDTLARLQQAIDGGQGDVRGHLAAILLEVTDVKNSMRALQESAALPLRQPMTTSQVGRVLDNITVTLLPAPETAYQTTLFLSKKRRARPSARGPSFWLEDKIQKWNTASTSSLIVVDGTRKMRFHLQWFCAESISILRETGIPVIWVLKAIVPDEDETAPDGVSPIDLIKYLVWQAALLNGNIHTDATMASVLQSFGRAVSDDDWLDILGFVLHGMPQLYIVLDVEVLSRASSGSSGQSWSSTLISLPAKLAERNVETVVKVVLVNYGSPFLREPAARNLEGQVVTVGRARQIQTPSSALPHRGKGAQNTMGGDVFDLGRLSGRGSQSRRGRLGKGGRWRLETETEAGKLLMPYGLDSLSAVELRRWASQRTGSELSKLGTANATSLVALSEKLAAELLKVSKEM
ncbi:hypothetical protein CPLU01_14354 [Colletotrichum plurivorum]|uniref:Polyketide synthase-like phosphopantetheine-binding domain-containing protein n=1 Tax=Colletotrichum plurivorum TaxID=2175906 RepID=A0A8H6JK56_9PEZI|nr:hypothetical protein CPLU01_14354 [Colletotrichum plurivorum]